jgi:hypothetical protein
VAWVADLVLPVTGLRSFSEGPGKCPVSLQICSVGKEQFGVLLRG